MIQVMLVDDHQVVRAGLAMLLESSDDLAVVGQAADGDEAVELYTQVVPDVVLMDLSLPTMDGVAATREICLANPGRTNCCPDVVSGPQSRHRCTRRRRVRVSVEGCTARRNCARNSKCL